MNFNKVELDTVEQLSTMTEQAIKELDDLELSLAGGDAETLSWRSSDRRTFVHFN
jgi:hypothetical protein